MTDRIEFAFERLQAYQRARQFVVLSAQVLEAMPRGEADLKDQLRRASDSMLLNIAEGAGRRSGRDKARFFDYARGSASECASVLDLIRIRKLAAPATAGRGRELLYEVVCMLTALARNSRARAG